MATNDFLPFSTSGTANVYTNAQYVADPDQANGNQPGLAKSKLVNKALRQCSIISTVIAQYIADVTGNNAVDDGTTTALLADLKNAVSANNTIGTIAALRLTPYTGQQIIYVTGYYTASDNIGVREYYWDAASSEADNGGTIIQVTGVVTGRWKMKVNGDVNVKWFGAKGDGITDDTAAFANAQDSCNDIYAIGDFVLNNFRHHTLKKFKIIGNILQGSTTNPAWNITSDVTTGQIVDISLIGAKFIGIVGASVEALRIQCYSPYVVKNAEIDIKGESCFHTLKINTTIANECYGCSIKVTQVSSVDTGCILSGAYNQYWMHIAGALNGISYIDSGSNSVYTQAVSEGMQQITGANYTVINPTVESWVGTPRGAALSFIGLSPTIINANIINVPSSKATIGLELNGGGSNNFIIDGIKVTGTVFPSYPLSIPAGNAGIIARPEIVGGFKLDAYTPDSVLKNISFHGDCSSLINKYSQATVLTDTFTPVLSFGGLSVGITYSVQLGIFSRVGNIVNFSLSINLSSKGTSTGIAKISGLPFISKNITNLMTPCAIFTENITTTSGYLTSVIYANSTDIYIMYNTITSASSETDTNFSNNSKISITGSYLI